MKEDERPILVSACLLGLKCRYDGSEGHISEEVLKLVKEGKAIPICPEILGGLPTPRPPAEIQFGKVMNVEGEDVTRNFQLGAEECAKIARLSGANEAILKDKSPSCGSTRIYDGSFTKRLIPGQGVTTALLRQEGMVVRAPRF